MNTPIYDFINKYIKKGISRLHMPGHKGKSFLGCEAYDITEIAGADVLSEASGIIAESEQNATELFGTSHTFYSTEGSSLAIRTMLALALSEWKVRKSSYDSSCLEQSDFSVSANHDETICPAIIPSSRPFILAARNVHKSFVYGCALLDLDVEWLYPDEYKSLCSCEVTAATVDQVLSEMKQKPIAVYLTSPDYLGFVQDIEGIAEVCDKYNIPLLVDNAHGAYTKFLKPSRHPIDLGAVMCCDSAHKTLPVLTGGAYLHVSKNAPASFVELARNTMAIFASTSPSYLILQSLDLCNQYLADDYERKLAHCIHRVNELKSFITSKGFVVEQSEPLKIVIDTLKSGYTGEELSSILREFQVEAEFADPEYLVMMFTPEIGEQDYARIETAFSSIIEGKDNEKMLSSIVEEYDNDQIYSSISPKNNNKKSGKPFYFMEKPIRRCSIREAVFGCKAIVSPEEAIGRISASPSVSCPPAIPIVVSGEEITAQAAELFEYYGIDSVEVLK